MCVLALWAYQFVWESNYPKWVTTPNVLDKSWAQVVMMAKGLSPWQLPCWYHHGAVWALCLRPPPPPFFFPANEHGSPGFSCDTHRWRNASHIEWWQTHTWISQDWSSLGGIDKSKEKTERRRKEKETEGEKEMVERKEGGIEKRGQGTTNKGVHYPKAKQQEWLVFCEWGVQ